MNTEAHSSNRWKAALAAAALVVALAAAVAAPRADAALPSGYYGVVPQTALTSTDFERMGQGNVGSVRLLFSWSSVDPSSEPDDYNWSVIDQSVGDAAQNGVEVLPFLFGTPQWVATELDGHACGEAECATFAPSSPAALDAWRDWVQAVAERYGPGGEFWTENPQIPMLPIRNYQIWNEQNSREFFAPKESPTGYAAMLDAASGVIRTADPGAQVILGGMAQLAGSSKATKATKYLRSFYKVNGVEANFDGIAVHPYGSSVSKVANQVEAFRKVAKRAGDRGAGTWITELGWGSAKGGNPLNRGKKGQAQRLKESFKYFKQQRKKLKIQTIQWFSWRDSSIKICDWCAKSGLFSKSLKAKPSFKAFTKFTGGS